MSTKAQTAEYDRGYEDAIEGHEPRSGKIYYVKGYVAGRMLACDVEGQLDRNDRAAS